MVELMDSYFDENNIKIIGVGGCGGSALEYMLSEAVEGVAFVVIDTDAQALGNSNADHVMQIGQYSGPGTGANLDVEHVAAMVDRNAIRELLTGTSMAFIIAGMDGVTGSVVAPIIAEVASELKILTIAVISPLIDCEDELRVNHARQGIRVLSEYVDSVFIMPSKQLLAPLGEGTARFDDFTMANDWQLRAVQGITDLLTRPGLTNIDLADVAPLIRNMGLAMMGSGSASGDERAKDAIEQALSSLRLEDVKLTDARSILANITAGFDLSMEECEDVTSVIKGLTSENTVVVIGSVIAPEMEDELRVTVVATGIGAEC